MPLWNPYVRWARARAARTVLANLTMRYQPRRRGTHRRPLPWGPIVLAGTGATLFASSSAACVAHFAGYWT